VHPLPTPRRVGRSDREDATGPQTGAARDEPTIELEVGPVAAGGSCVARHEGRVVFVRHTLPGELVRARVTERQRSFWRADAVEVLRAARERVDAPCRYAHPGGCGGCDWQHVDPATQRRHKATLVAEQLRRVGHLDREVEVAELPGGALGWRSRTRFATGPGARLGLHPHRSHQVLPLEECLLLTEQAAGTGILPSRWPGAAAVEVLASSTGGGRAVEISPHAHRSVRVADLPPDVAVLRRDGPARSRVLRGQAAVTETVLGRDYRVSGSAFWQAHPAAAATFVTAVRQELGAVGGRHGLDLYAGVGLFAAALADDGARMDAVESDPGAAADARHNCQGLAVTVHHGRVERLVGELAAVDFAVLDPPRSGLTAAVCAALAGQVTGRIAYLSCDPATLARDLARFAEAGWRVGAVRGFDAFPMTAHVECLAVLDAP
jgi:tRNA/tmRNA/rRNA uracil-C5-methylase (TrmA/RlmC/RlmD family)